MTLEWRIRAALVTNYHKTKRVAVALYLGKAEVRELDAVAGAPRDGERRLYADLPVYAVDSESHLAVSV